ncbi:lasso peptide biosynthesis B2 protein [Phenylobacterium sp.]|jgi:hypothetical protein|uniref:lasso peptide biosynthesis B2 protein n=1 Tax=Phenylobacterium sp. TaxID=1871053 RepID=UPI002F42552B
MGSIPLHLRPDVHAVQVEADVVLLDIAADRYLCLPGAGGLLTVGPGRAIEAHEPAAAEGLVGAGLAGLGAVMPDRPCPPPSPARSALDGHAAEPLTFPEVGALLGAWLDLLRHYRGRTFAQIVVYIARGHRPSSAERRAAALRLAAKFERAAIWLPAPRKCLVRSFLLLRFLQRRGADAQWVLGVRTWPFAAHCWAQVGDVALDDVPERLVGYRPICVV